MAAPQDAWSSHIWTEQTLIWLYTGKVDSSDWFNLTELYFVGDAAGSVALKRSAITQLQKACRDDQSNRTKLFHYGHISVIEEMVGASSPLSRYVEDTYFNHWSPEADCDGVNDDPSNHPKSSLFFKRLFQRSFKEQKEAENCSCCHDHCKYHGHESEAERLATCGRSSCPVPPTTDIKPEAVVHKARKNKAAVRTSLTDVPAPDIHGSSSHETRTTTSRSATPKGKAAAGDTWLTVHSHAPVPQHYPAEYHGLLTSLPQVQSIKPSNWLEIGVQAEGVDQLPEPDRIIAAAMSWNAEDYAQTKCTFFNQYDAAITNRHHWLNTLKFGGSKPKEKAERLLAMWESLGWLKSSEVVTNDRVQHPTFPITSASEPRSVADLTTMRPRLSFTGKWSEEERDAVATIMKSINTDESCARLNSIQRAGICNKRLKSEYRYHRTDRAVEQQWYKIQQELAGATTVEAQDQAVPDKEQDLLEDTCKKPGSWPSQEQQALLEIMNALEKTHKDTTLIRRAEMCKSLLKSRCGTERTLAAISAQYHRLRSRKEAVPSNNSTNAAVNDSAIDGVLPIILKTPLTTVGDGRNESAGSNDASRTASQFRWSDHEDKAMLKVFKEIEEDSSLSILNEREKAKVCSARLLSKHNITRTPESIRGRCERLSSTSALKRKGDDDFDDHEPLMSRQKRRQTGSRFVAELFDAGED
ncbi:hypothetical protein KCU78_g2999, partial [Aureobasidium melanogenum]